jgi:hypothetical protein
MRELIAELVGGTSILTKGWLKPLLKTGKKLIKSTELKGYACLVGTKARWKGALIVSTAK